MTSSVKQTVIKNPTWWKRRTSMERGLTLISACAVIIGISLAVALATVLYQNSQGKSNESTTLATEALHGQGPTIISAYPDDSSNNVVDNEYCLSKGCIHTASKVLKYMDETVDPCEDFYQFACGSFLKETNIPDDKSSVTSFSVITDQLQDQLRTMIEEPVHEEEPQPFQLTKNLYKACMNKSAIETDGLTTIKEILLKLGGWPALEGDNWDEDSFDWKQAIYNYRETGYSIDYLIDFSVGIDLKNSSRRIIDLDQASLGLRREFLIKGTADKLVKAYYDYMVDIAVLFGAERERATRELNTSLHFEIQLANISLPSEKRRNATALYNPMSISELQEKYPSVPWLEYINKLLHPVTTVNEDEIVIVNVLSYLSDFEELIAKTPKRVVANYLLWRAAAASVSYLTEELRQRQLQYSTIVTGKTERASRWKECIDVTSGRYISDLLRDFKTEPSVQFNDDDENNLSIAAGALYVRKYFNEDARQNAQEMVGNIRAEFKQIIKTIDWMDDTTRQSALEKVDAMTTHIAYPDELLDDRKLQEFYGNLQVNPEKYLKSVLNLTLFGTEFSFKRLRQPVNKTDWITHGRPAIVNAFYSSIENSIQFPAGILQGVFFNNDRPKYMNYGAIGFVIGHEITHGFDDQGRQFDKDGNLVDWWEPDTQKAFVKKAQCIIDQYGNYTVPEIGMKLNGINTQGENIADNGGIKEAYMAYTKWVENNGQEKKLPGIKYTGEQLFWWSAASVWCSKTRLEELRQQVVTDEHAPDKYRVLGAISNMEEFAKDYHCPKGSKMSPETKCSVW